MRGVQDTYPHREHLGMLNILGRRSLRRQQKQEGHSDPILPPLRWVIRHSCESPSPLRAPRVPHLLAAAPRGSAATAYNGPGAECSRQFSCLPLTWPLPACTQRKGASSSRKTEDHGEESKRTGLAKFPPVSYTGFVLLDLPYSSTTSTLYQT